MNENNKKLSDAEQKLIIALKEKNSSAFNQLYELYARPLYGFIKKLLLNEEAADRTLLSTFEVIWLSIDSYNCTQERFYTWAAKIARKEINKQRVQIILQQLFRCKQTDLAQVNS